jgi:hypothetical protein
MNKEMMKELLDIVNLNDPKWRAQQAAINKMYFILDAVRHGYTAEEAKDLAECRDDLDWVGVTNYPVYDFETFVEGTEHAYHLSHYVEDEANPEYAAYWTHGNGKWLGRDGGDCEDLAALPAKAGDPEADMDVETMLNNA